ncbi:MAG: nuclease-related domain-containing protein [Phycisphaeraceae bacterium]
MAREHGQRGNYPAGQRRRMVRIAMGVALGVEAFLGFALGILVGTNYLRFPSMGAWGLLLINGIVLVMIIMASYVLVWFNRHEKQLWNYVDGAAGEERIGEELAKLPNTFEVIHGLETPSGDVDHLVIGPTGVFLLNTKKWTGVATAANGALLWNGKNYKDHVGNMRRITMALRDMVVQPGGPDPYFQEAFVFVGCTVNIGPEQLGRCDALTPDQLLPYLQRSAGRRGLKAAEVEDLASRAAAFLR